MDPDIINYDNQNNPIIFFFKVFIGVVGGIIIGALIDTLCRNIQNENIDWTQRNLLKSLLFFIIQITINIIVLLLLCIIFPVKFIEWFQLTISGALFAVLLFTAQRNLIDNTLRITLLLS